VEVLHQLSLVAVQPLATRGFPLHLTPSLRRWAERALTHPRHSVPTHRIKTRAPGGDALSYSLLSSSNTNIQALALACPPSRPSVPTHRIKTRAPGGDALSYSLLSSSSTNTPSGLLARGSPPQAPSVTPARSAPCPYDHSLSADAGALQNAEKLL